MASGGYWRDSLALSGMIVGTVVALTVMLSLPSVRSIPDWLLMALPWASSGLHFVLGAMVGTSLDRIRGPGVWRTAFGLSGILLSTLGGTVGLILIAGVGPPEAVPLVSLVLVIHMELTWWIGPTIGGAIDRSRNWRREMSDPRKENP